MLESVVQIIGIVVVFAFIILGIDDLLWDIFALLRGTKAKNVDLAVLDQEPPKMLAIAIAAWQEDKVIGDVVDNLIESVSYPKDMYCVFIGVYPNDSATNSAVDKLAARHSNVVKIVNAKEGPTSKANNLNHMMGGIMAYEKEREIRFAGITIHDSEDVVHPLELKITSHLIDTYDALQFPVFPLMRMPRFSNYFKTLTVGTYTDEFAEHHYRTLSIRDQLGFVPSAGTGFCLNRSFLDSHGDGTGIIMKEDSLTEDYDLSLTMNKQGYRVHYVLESVLRVDSNGRYFHDYIATRSMFPKSFTKAVRQKTRWIYGITMQSARLRDVFAKNELNFRDRTLLYKDLKAKFANLILLPGYLVFLYFLIALFFPELPIMYPYWSLGWWLCVVLAFMMIERQFLRGKAILKVYGARMLFFSCLLPPLFPIRLIWGNVINFWATVRAWRQKCGLNRLVRANREKESSRLAAQAVSSHGEAASKYAEVVSSYVDESSHVDGLSQKHDSNQDDAPKQEWAKTEHEFLPKDVLQRYRRRYGDFLLMKGALSSDELKEVLTKSADGIGTLGERLLTGGVIGTRELAEATAAQNNTVCVHISLALERRMARFQLTTKDNKAIWPIMETAVGYLAITSEKQIRSAGPILENVMDKPVFLLLADSSELDEAVLRLESPSNTEYDGDLEEDMETLASLCDGGILTLAQAGLVLGYATNREKRIVPMLQSMGLACQSGLTVKENR